MFGWHLPRSGGDAVLGDSGATGWGGVAVSGQSSRALQPWRRRRPGHGPHGGGHRGRGGREAGNVSRTRGSRGTLPGRMALVTELVEARTRLLTKVLDAMSDAAGGGAFGGGTLPRRDHLILLAQDPDYQARQIARIPFASAAERERLKRDIAQATALYPTELPAEVAQPPRLGIPELDEGIA